MPIASDTAIFRIAGVGGDRFTVTLLDDGQFEVRVTDRDDQHDFKAAVVAWHSWCR